jgi:16S rRNA (cytosine967-C5)-methyltransferase
LGEGRRPSPLGRSVGLERDADGLAARRAALDLLDGVLREGRPLDDLLDDSKQRFAKLDGRDRSFAHALTAATLRRKGEIDLILATYLQKPLPKSSGPARLILAATVSQLLYLDTPAHAAIHQAVTLAQEDKMARHFASLVNAVLRRVAADSPPALDAGEAARANTPSWLFKRWERNYSLDGALRIARAHAQEAPVDITVKNDPAIWAERLNGTLLPTGTIRLAKDAEPVSGLPGYDEGAWWVQDAAAALPARLLGNVAGRRIADLCAAPGGKAAQLAAAGAEVVAIDNSAARLKRMADNMRRLSLRMDLVEADILAWKPEEQFDAVLLDAPCTATGTIRRHPDLPYVKSEDQIARLAVLQKKMLARAARWLKPGGTLVYSTCSLEPEEGEAQIDVFLSGSPQFRRLDVSQEMVAGQDSFINKNNDLRIHPGMRIGPETGLDGFFASRLQRIGDS